MREASQLSGQAWIGGHAIDGRGGDRAPGAVAGREDLHVHDPQGFRFSPPSYRPVTAETFKYTIERSLSPKLVPAPWPVFENVAGGTAYMTGKAPHISGIVARGNELTIHLLSPAPELSAYLTHPEFSAVPTNTPISAKAEPKVPSAGRTTSPRTCLGRAWCSPATRTIGAAAPPVARIELKEGISSQRAASDVEAGIADYAPLLGPGPPNLRALTSGLAARL